MKTHFLIFLSLIFFIFSEKSFAQGCSDAGFCTMGAMRPNQEFGKTLSFFPNSFQATWSVEQPIPEMLVNSIETELIWAVSPKSYLQFKLPYVFIQGNLGSVSGVGDISLSYTRVIKLSLQNSVGFTIGTKIPTGSTNLQVENRPLHMFYQTGLGTYDLVLGASWLNRDWLFSAALQHPFNANQNQFEQSLLSNEENVGYTTSRGYFRGTDLMFRVERSFRFSRFSLHTGVLPIYRINNDRVQNEENIWEEVEGSNGFTVSWVSGFNYNLNAKTSFRLLYMQRLKRREAHPGQSKEYLFSMTLATKF